ncbi:MAG: 3-isopropylmalate dehydratase small subunit [Syntrophales bacterium]
MKYRGKVWKFGDNIDTDVIIPARCLTTFDPEVLASHCMEGLDREFVRKVSVGDIIVAGENFGCGSSREHAPIAIKAAGISCIVARSFARIFYRNAFNMGLPIFESKDMWDLVSEGQEIDVDGDAGKITIVGSKMPPLSIQPIPPFMQELIRDGGLLKHLSIKRK